MANHEKTLRKRAEERLQQVGVSLDEPMQDEVRQLIYELQVHQIELEMQNEELRQIQQELQESRDRYAELYDFAPVGYLTIDPNGLITQANLTCTPLFGRERYEMLRLSIDRLIVKEDQDSFYLHRRKMLNTRTPQSCEVRMHRQDGSPFWAALECTPVFDETGTVTQIRIVIADISARKQAEEVLYQREETFRALVEHAPDVVARFDKNLRHVYVNPAVEQVSGKPPHVFIGKTNQELGMPEHLVSLWNEKTLEVFETGQEVSMAFDFLTPGGRHYYESRLVPECGKDGSVETVLVTTRDITERKQAEQELQGYRDQLQDLVDERTGKLRETSEALTQEIQDRQRAEEAIIQSEQQYRVLAQNVAEGIYIIRQQTINFVNQAFARIFGRLPADLIGTDFLELVPEDHQEEVQQILTQCLEQDRVFRGMQFPCLPGSGQEFWIEANYNRIEWQGTPAVLGSVRDITIRREWELKMSRENIALKKSMKDRYRLGQIIGKSVSMQILYEQVLRAADSDAHVVIYGESGSGKELVASTIHQLSHRQEQAFVPVNCGAITETLFESAFFGHRKGAFTGATSENIGYFEAAHNGVLFLDEISELTADMQVSLLRALESGEYTPVGGHTPRKTNIRIIAATNKDLKKLHSQGAMRTDFFYRIHVLSLTVPPLRERKDDILLLTEHFLKRYTADSEDGHVLPGHILEAFQQYDWPGNVRELQNLLQQYLAGQSLDFQAGQQKAFRQLEDRVFSEITPSARELREALERFEKRYILQMLEQHHWHKQKTAAALGIPRRTLYRKLHKYEIL